MSNNNKQQQKSFANIISKEDYDNLIDSDQFEIDNEIRIPTAYEMNIPDDEVYKNTLMLLNPILVDEIYHAYILDKTIDDNCELNMHKDKISIKLSIAVNNKNKINLLEKEYKKYSKKLEKIDLLKDLYRVNKSLNIKSKRFIKLIKNSIFYDDDIYVDFITEGYDMNFYNHWLFKEWNKIEIYTKILKHLNEKIQLIQLATNNRATTKQQLNKKSYHPIFLGLDEENIFFELLEVLNAIDEKGSPKKRKLNPICDAIFSSRTDLKEQIFKYNINENEYVAYLKRKYPTEFKKERLSSGIIHIEKVNEKLTQLLKMHKQQKLDKQQ